tara:strand:- start:804 stop:1301 length:498 start_codon:yes stop_codon:yes gene_type:complete
MPTSKAEAIEQLNGPNSVSHQQALVKKILGSESKKTVKRVIPGGKTLVEDLSDKDLAPAVYTWLRHCRHFTSAVLSFARDPSSLNISETKVIDFDSRGKLAEWETRGKKWLSERIADIIMRENVVAVRIEKDGLYLITDKDGTFSPETEEWEPYIQFSPFRPPVF